MTNPYLSGRWDYLEINMGMGSVMSKMPKRGEHLLQIQITVCGGWENLCILGPESGAGTSDGGQSVSPTARKQLTVRVVQ